MESYRHADALRGAPPVAGCVEILVHLDKSELPRDYVWSWTEFNETPAFLQFEDLDQVSACQAAGRSWVRTAGRLSVLVPSVVIPQEFNILLNPTHTEYTDLFGVGSFGTIP